MKEQILKLKQEHPDWGKKKIAKIVGCSTTTVRHYLDPKFAKRKQDRHSELTQARIKKFKIKAIELMGGKCIKCGYKKCIAALDFHHLDPKTKDGPIGNLKSWEAWKNEISKCILVCSNCHREIHHPNE